jgi:P pilus assembly chaperone PapD
MLAWALTTGFSVTPVVLDAVSIGPRSSAQVTVTNPNPTNLPVEITIQEVTMDEKGAAKDRRDASADFVILPPQATLNAGQARVFTLQYIGEADLAESRYFEWSVDQVPVTLPEGENAVQIVYAISGILCVAPATGKSDVSVVGTAIETTTEGKFHPILSMRNAGNAHAFMSRGVLRLSMRDKDGKITWRQTLRAQEIGLGAYADNAKTAGKLTLAKARVEAAKVRAEVKAGRNVVSERKAGKAERIEANRNTFAVLAKEVHKHRASRRNRKGQQAK